MIQTFISYANSLAPNLDGDRIELWLKTGHYQYLRATYKAGEAESAIVRPLKAEEGKPCKPSKINGVEELENWLDSPITWEQLYDRTTKIKDGLLYYPQMPVGLPLGDYAVDAGDMVTIEFDHSTIEQQQELLQEFERVTKLKFFSKIFSGKKSTHANLALTQRMDWSQMTHLFRLAFLTFLSDPSLGSRAAIARYPGGYRKGDGANKLQDLTEHHQARYGYQVLRNALSAFYQHRYGVTAPDFIPDQWWGEIRGKLIDPTKHGDPLPMIKRGIAPWQEEKRQEEARVNAIRRQRQSEVRQDLDAYHKYTKAAWAAIRRAREAAPRPQLGKEQKGRDRYVGFCPIHGGKSGTSARLREINSEWKFACWTCTHDGRTRVDIDPLEFAYLEAGHQFCELPRGNNDDWLLLPHLEDFAREFCRRNNVTMPERKEPIDKEPIDKTVKKKTPPTKGQPKVAQQEEPIEKPENNVVEIKRGKNDRWTAALLKRELQALVNKGLDASEQEAEILDICDKSGYGRHEIKDLLQKIKEGDTERSLDNRFVAVSRNLENSSFCLPSYFYGGLAGLNELSGVSFAAIQVPILSVVSSLCSMVELVLVPSTGRVVRPQIWGAVVGQVGGQKSFIVNIARSPLIEKDLVVSEKYEEALRDWEKLKKSDDKAEPPELVPKFCMHDFTLEAVEKQLIINAGQGLLIHTDELKTWFGGFGRYNKGGGAFERSRWCQLYEGTSYDKSRVKDMVKGGQQCVYVKNPTVALCGSIQPDVLLKIMRGDTADGLTERFVLSLLPPNLPELQYDTEEVEMVYMSGEIPRLPLHRELSHLYSSLIALNNEYRQRGEKLRIFLSAGAKEINKAFHQKLCALANTEDSPFVRPLYTKHQTHALKIALASHVSRMAVGEIDRRGIRIDEDTMRDAVTLAEHSLSTAMEIWLESEDSHDYEVVAAKVCRRYPGETVKWDSVRRLSRNSSNDPMLKKDEVIAVFKYMERRGYGTWDKEYFTVKENTDE